MKKEEIVKMFYPILKRREIILFLLIVVINGLICIDSDIGLDTCARERCGGVLGLNTLCRDCTP